MMCATGVETHAVTGAFGYSGRYIAQRLLAAGRRVITLTNVVPYQDPFEGRVARFPLAFHSPRDLVTSLRGVTVLHNTYWIRFNHKLFTHADAVANTLTLFGAAKEAGVERVIHVSITNPSRDSPLEYFSGKAELEDALKTSGLSYAILRPTVLFGKEDILINNIAWILRRFPVFGVFGDGTYRLVPIYVDDLAALAARYAEERDNVTVDAVGPETFTYRELVESISHIIGRRRPIVSVSPNVAYWVGRALGVLTRDVVVTREEIQGLMADLLYVESPPTGSTRLTEWARAHSAHLGRKYTSELARRRPS